MQDDHGFEPLAVIEARLVARAPAAEPARSLRLRLAARQATVGEREAAVALLNAELARADRPAGDGGLPASAAAAVAQLCTGLVLSQ